MPALPFPRTIVSLTNSGPASEVDPLPANPVITQLSTWSCDGRHKEDAAGQGARPSIVSPRKHDRRSGAFTAT